MPTGLSDALTHQEFLDLVRFLSELGKPGPYGPSSPQLVRRWRIMEAAPESLPAGDLPAALAADGSNWLPVYSLVWGTLPPDAFRISADRRLAYARCEIEASTPGEVHVAVGNPVGLSIWLDGRRVEPKNELSINLSAGVHALTFGVDFKKRGLEGLRVELRDATHARPVGGR